MAGVEIAEAYVTLLPSMRGMRRQIASEMTGVGSVAGQRMGEGMRSRLKSMASRIFAPLAAAAGSVAVGALFKSIVTEASEAQQSIGATEALFGKYADTVIKRSRDAADALGMSANEYRNNANLLASLLKNQGVAQDELADKTHSLVKLGADLAAMYGGTVTEAVEALTSAYKGEFNPLEKYGISLRKSDINARLAAEGKDKLTGASLRLAEQEALTALIFEQSAAAQGQNAREADTFAGQTMRLNARLQNLKEQVGMFILPYLTDLAGWLGEKVVPAISNFFTEMRTGEGIGGKFANFLREVRDRLKAAWDWIVRNQDTLKGLAVAAASAFAAFQVYRGLKVLTDVNKWVGNLRKGMQALNAVMKANTVGIIIAAIAALIGYLVYLYNTNEDFRNFVQAAWNKIKEVVGGVVTWFRETAWPVISSVFQWIGDKATWLWNNAIKPAFNFVWNLLKTVWGWLRDTAWPIAQQVFQWIGNKVMWLWNNAVKPYFTFVWNLLKTVWNWLSGTAWPIARNVFQWIGDKAGWLWANAIRPAFTFIWDKIKGVWDWLRNTAWPIARNVFQWIGDKASWLWEKAIKPAFDLIKSGISKVVDAFETAKDGIGKAWDMVRKAVAKPIVAVVGFINDGIIGGINWVLTKLGLDHLKLGKIQLPAAIVQAAKDTPRSRSGGRSLREARGGILPGWSPGKDNYRFIGEKFDLWLAGGEAIMRPEWTKAVGADFVEQMNAIARTRGVHGVRKAMGLARGGVVPGPKGGNVVDWFKDRWNDIAGFFDSLNPVQWLIDKFKSFLPVEIAKIWLDIATGIIGKVASGAKDWIFEQLGLGGGSGEPGNFRGGRSGKGLPWRAIWAMIQEVAPEARLTSAYRPGARTASGYVSYHALGRAVDFVSPNMMATFLKVRRLLPWSELYYSPAGWLQLQNGRRHFPRGITRAMHFDHIHAAYAQGGIFTGLFDKGGYLPPGLSLVLNNTGKPEPVLTDDQWERLAETRGDITINNYNVPMDHAGEVARTTLYHLRRIDRGGKYQRRR